MNEEALAHWGAVAPKTKNWTHFFTDMDKIRSGKSPRTAVRRQSVSCGEIYTLPKGVK